jgi:hypothetical protein
MPDIDLVVEDITLQALNFDKAYAHGPSPLYEFFQFGRYPRTFCNPLVLKDCHFFELHASSYVDKWPSSPPPPNPGMFEKLFANILRSLTGEGNRLTLHVKSFDDDYFEELEVVKTLLAPHNLSYIFLSNSSRIAVPGTRSDVGNLIFEWPLDSLDHVVEHWFMSPIVSIEGYISRQSVLPKIAELYFQADTEARIRELLRSLEVGFRIWQDNNGLFLLSDKLDESALKERLYTPQLVTSLKEASRRAED